MGRIFLMWLFLAPALVQEVSSQWSGRWSQWSEWGIDCSPADCGFLGTQSRTRTRRLSTETDERDCVTACGKGGTTYGYGCHCMEGYTGDCCGQFNEQAAGCKPPPSIHNGEIEYDGIMYGDVVTYSCDDGYILDGDAVRVCTNNGVWSGDTPSCDWECPCINGGNCLNGNGEQFECVCPPDYTGYRCESSDSWNNWSSWTQWTSCTDECGTGGKQSRSRTHCRSSSSNICENNIETQICNNFCNNGGTPKSGQCDCIYPNTGKCCESVVQCDDPPILSNGSIIGSTQDYGSMIAYQCDTNFVRSGDMTRFCIGSPPRWNGSNPSCIFVCPCTPGGSCIASESNDGNNNCRCNLGYSGPYCSQVNTMLYLGLASITLIILLAFVVVSVLYCRKLGSTNKTRRPLTEEAPPSYDSLGTIPHPAHDPQTCLSMPLSPPPYECEAIPLATVGSPETAENLNNSGTDSESTSADQRADPVHM